MSSLIEDHVRRELVRFLVQKTIFCPRTEVVLDIRTCVVILDSDGDPAFVMSQKGWAEIDADPAQVGWLADKGYAVDRDTVTA
jgi:hypothetical protein